MSFRCPKCEHVFKSTAQTGAVQCPNCGKVLQLRPKAQPAPQPNFSAAAGGQDLNAVEWMVAREGKTFGPYSIAQMREYLQTGRLSNTDSVWAKGMESWAAITTILPEASAPPAPVPPPPAAGSRFVERDDSKREFLSKKIPAALCGIFLGGLGIHKFVLGLTNGGTTMLLVWVACVFTSVILIIPVLGAMAIAVIGFVEGIIYLTKSDEDFYQTYAIEKKQWF